MDPFEAQQRLAVAGHAMYAAVGSLQVTGPTAGIMAYDPDKIQELKGKLVAALQDAIELDTSFFSVHIANQTHPHENDMDGFNAVNDYVSKASPAALAAIEWLKTMISNLGNLDEDDKVPQFPAPKADFPEGEAIWKRPLNQPYRNQWDALDAAYATLKNVLKLNTLNPQLAQALSEKDKEVTVSEHQPGIQDDPKSHGPNNGKGPA